MCYINYLSKEESWLSKAGVVLVLGGNVVRLRPPLGAPEKPPPCSFQNGGILNSLAFTGTTGEGLTLLRRVTRVISGTLSTKAEKTFRRRHAQAVDRNALARVRFRFVIKKPRARAE